MVGEEGTRRPGDWEREREYEYTTAPGARREPDFEYTEVRGRVGEEYEPTMGRVGRVGGTANVPHDADPEKVREWRRAAMTGIDRTEMGAAGIAILTGLFTLAGVMHVLTALGVTAGFAGLTQVAATIPGFEQLVGLVGGYSVFALILGVADFIAAWGLWNLKSWSWTLGVVLAILGFFVLPFGPIGSILLLVYLLQDEVHRPFKIVARAKEEGRAGRRYARGV